MPLHILPATPQGISGGERRLLDRLEALYASSSGASFAYSRPRLREATPHIILFDPARGISIIQVNDLTPSGIRGFVGTKIDLADSIRIDNPLAVAKRYHALLKGLLLSSEHLLNEEGRMPFTIGSRVIFTRIRSKDQVKGLLTESFLPTHPIFQAGTDTLNLDALFEPGGTVIDDDVLQVARGILFPEIVIKKRVQAPRTSTPPRVVDEPEDLLKALDAEQEAIARALPYGHVMVSGVPGSGKTVILLARALHLAKENPDWRILVVTYNRSLKSKLESVIKGKEIELSFMQIPIKNIEVVTFHRLALNLAGIGVPQRPPQEFWDEVLPEAAFARAQPMYDAVLIDEYQDFRESWIRTCKAVAKASVSNEDQKSSECIFLAGDRLQSIYNPKELSWSDLGINIQGGSGAGRRSQTLKLSYRTGKLHITTALEMLLQDPAMAKEVERFYEGREGIGNRTKIADEIVLLEGMADSVVEHISTLVSRGIPAQDLLILAPTWRHAEAIHKSLPPSLHARAQVGKDVSDDALMITTYHSSKGLERGTCILSFIDEVDERKLLYVGMTRASHRLYLHSAKGFRGPLARPLKDLIEARTSTSLI